MTKRRTRKEKLAAQHSYQPSYALEALTAQTAKPDGSATAAPSITAIGVNETELIKKDLLKSVLISGLILVIEFSIFWYWSR